MHNCVFVCIKPLSYRNGSISMLLYFVNCSVFCTYIKYSNIFYQLSKVLFCKFCHLHLYYFSLYLHFYIVQYTFSTSSYKFKFGSLFFLWFYWAQSAQKSIYFSIHPFIPLYPSFDMPNIDRNKNAE